MTLRAGVGESSVVLSDRQLNRTLLTRQLLGRCSLPAASLLERLVGMQAQTPNSPYLALWSRLERFETTELARLLRERAAVRIVLMRSTIHLVTAADCLTLRPVLQPMLAKGLASSQYGRQIVGLDLQALAAAGRELVEQRPLTLARLGQLLAERWPDRDPVALGYAIRNLAALVQPPPRGIWGEGGAAKHTSAEAWLGQPLSSDSSPDALILRYLGAFGPASVRDAQNWSGLTRLRPAFERLRPRLRSFRDERGAELFDLPDAPLADAELAAPPRFLPDYDNLLLGHADRARIVPPEYRARIFTGNAIRPTILLDGFVGGVWSVSRGRGVATLHIQPFAPLSAHDRAAFADEGARLLDFVAGDSQTRVIEFDDSE